ncbi:MAG TPA: Pr6Pr family membrane protein [Sphingomicrobium sp.]|nr:Pr6Pr family membrane protein [Sphingomicrobium sp.]
MRASRLVAAGLAVAAWAGLVLQYVLLIHLAGVVPGSWRFVGFFTILSNIGIATMATAIALGRTGLLTGSRARLMGLTAIVTVGFVYSLLLRSLWNPVGWAKVADMVLHDVTPILTALLWALMPHGELRWGDLKWALAPPALYLAYSMTRGAFDGWYPYYFLNPALQSTAELAIGIASTLFVFATIAGSAIAIDMRMGRRGG